MKEEFKFIDSTSIKVFCEEALKAAGLNKTCSENTAEGLVLASLRGVDSHGIQLLPHYVKSIMNGRLNRNPDFRFTESTPTTSILDADHAIGFTSGKLAMEQCMKLADKNGMGAVSVHNSSHGGMLAYYTIPAAEKNYFAMAVTNTTPRMVPPNGKNSFLGTNPFCYAFPLQNEGPLCYDSATSQITGNKINQYKRLGMTLPEGVAADKNGYMTTDPQQAVNLFAFGDYRGFGIALLVDILCGVLASMPNSDRVSKMFADNYSEKRYLGQFYMVFKIDAFRSISEFTVELQDEIDRLRLNRKDETSVYAPGDKEKELHLIRSHEGIPVDNNLMLAFSELSDELNINVKL